MFLGYARSGRTGSTILANVLIKVCKNRSRLMLLIILANAFFMVQMALVTFTCFGCFSSEWMTSTIF